jgi:hypothetical protein
MFRAEHYPPVSLCAAGTPERSEPLAVFGPQTSFISRFERLTPREPLALLAIRCTGTGVGFRATNVAHGRSCVILPFSC